MTALQHPEHTREPSQVGRLATHRQAIQKEYHGARSRELGWSWGRLLTFAAAASAWYPLRDLPPAAAVITALAGVAFVVAVARHRRARSERESAERLLLVVDESGRRIGGEVTLIRFCERPREPADSAAVLAPALDAGSVWPLTQQERDDLDLYAPPVGVFGLLNRTSTVLGARRLRDLVEHPCLSIERILSRQAAVRWLEEHTTERLRIMAAAACLRRRDDLLDQFVRAVRRAVPLPWPTASVLLRIWSVLTAVITLFAATQLLVGQWRWGWAIFWLLALNSLIFLRIRRALVACLAPWRNASIVATGYLHAAERAAEELPTETNLGRLRDCFAAIVGRHVLPSLRRRVVWADTGGTFHALFNLMFFYDLHVAEAILARVVPNRDPLLAGLSALAELEALASLACFAWEQPVRCYPVPVEDPALFIAGGVHPLIPPQRVVANDLRLTPAARMWVVTGSNMAGKSTFLRMVGLNCLLAQIGATAVAREMTYVPARLITDLQVRDNLSQGESYFLAEVRHLRRMIAPPEQNGVILGLMDEPFRGTNSTEKVAASMAVIRHLTASPGFFVVATHEMQLTALADGSPAANYHFREDLEADGLVFDYRLRPGPAETRNALRILELEGYPAEVLEKARRWLKDATDA